MNTVIVTSLMCGFSMLCDPIVIAQRTELSARDIMEKNFFVSKVSNLTIDSSMVLIDARGGKRERRNLTLIKLQPNGMDSKVVIKFSTPADIKGTGVLQVEHIDGDDDLWISYALNDHWKVLVGAELYRGESASVFGLLRPNTAAYVEARWSF